MTVMPIGCLREFSFAPPSQRNDSSFSSLLLSPPLSSSLLLSPPLLPSLASIQSHSPNLFLRAVEVIGYAFRLYSHSDVAARSPYIGQLATLVIAPTFFSAALCT